MQRLADGHGVGATVVAGQADMQLLVEQDAHFQIDLMRPIREAASRCRQYQLNPIVFDAGQGPDGRARETMGAGRLITLAHRLDALRVAVKHTKPRPAHRHTRTDTFASLEYGLVVGPDHRLGARRLVAEDVRALLGHQHFGAVVADAPAVQLIHFHGFKVGRRHTRLS